MSMFPYNHRHMFRYICQSMCFDNLLHRYMILQHSRWKEHLLIPKHPKWAARPWQLS